MMKYRDKLIDNIENELDKIAEVGIVNVQKLESASKLVDMLKDFKNIEYWDDVQMSMADGSYSRYGDGGAYSMTGGYSMNGNHMRNNWDRGNSYRRRRDSMGRYSRAGGMDTYEKFMDDKDNYRTRQTPEAKQRMMDSLEAHLEEFVQKVEDMARDSDFPEERATIMRYMSQLKNM